ncbi:hypothetical protein Pint_05882 [Pistacia integerrima]|uniref:Uncharacterized protein n=1 Tax=Pistacia integerrima TaxID=434235 RepID=A0ACC0Z607_9ROSI|nr:hypothetical protein Pint_05882 [Pistacia integerrima]
MIRFSKSNPRKFLQVCVLFAQNPKKNDLETSEKDAEKQQANGSVNEPDPDNIFAVGLTGVLTWASVQVLWQLLVISSAILVAALKYSFIAALLLFILITLL